MRWDLQNRRRRQSMRWRRSYLCAGIICLLYSASRATATAIPDSCYSECRWGRLGATGVADLIRPLMKDPTALCRDYASRVAGHTQLIECGHVDVGAAVAACGFGATLADHCSRHKNAAVAVMVVSHVASIAVWFPLARLFVLAARSRRG